MFLAEDSSQQPQALGLRDLHLGGGSLRDVRLDLLNAGIHGSQRCMMGREPCM